MYTRLYLLVLLVLPGCLQIGNSYSPRQAIIPSESHVVPLRFDGAHYLVDVLVNGTGPYLFVLDTGCSSVVLSEELASTLGLKTKPAGESLVTSWDSITDYSRADVASIRLGDMEFQNTQVRILGGEVNRLFAGRSVSGIVGFSLFWDRVWTFDGPGQRIVVGSVAGSSETQGGRGSPLPMRLNGRCPHVTASVRRRGEVRESQVDVLIDTGAGTHPNLPALDLPTSMQIKPLPNLVASVRTATGLKEMEVGTVDHVSIGEICCRRMFVGLAPRKGNRWVFERWLGLWVPVATDGTSGVVGLGILRDWVITFDRPGGRLWIQHPASPVQPATAPAERAAGEADGTRSIEIGKSTQRSDDPVGINSLSAAESRGTQTGGRSQLIDRS